MFSLVFTHLKLRIIVFSLPLNELFISIEGVGPLPQSPPYCTAIFLQKPRVDKPNTGCKEGLLRFYTSFTATVGSLTLEGEGRWENVHVLQSAT